MRFRAPTLHDAPAVLAVVVARDVADIGVPDFALGDLRDEWGEAGIDLRNDAVVVERGGEIVAYALVRREGVFAVVHPEHEGRGIGAAAVGVDRAAGARARPRALPPVGGGRQSTAASLCCPTPATRRSAATGAWCERWTVAWSRWRRRTACACAPLDVDHDAVALHALDAASFASVPDYKPHTLQQFVDEHLRPHDLRPDLSCIAELGERMLGFALCRHWVDERVGFVDVLAVHPDHQRRGLGSALLRNSFAGFAAAGLKEAQLGVASDNPRALALYERVGMHARFQTDVYERAAG